MLIPDILFCLYQYTAESLTCTSSSVSLQSGQPITIRTPTACGFVGNPTITYRNPQATVVGTSNVASGTSFTLNTAGFVTGTNTITASAADGSGNAAQCTFTGKFKVFVVVECAFNLFVFIGALIRESLVIMTLNELSKQYGPNILKYARGASVQRWPISGLVTSRTACYFVLVGQRCTLAYRLYLKGI